MRRIQLTNLIILILTCLVAASPAVSAELEIGDENAQINIDGSNVGLYYLITNPQGMRAGYDYKTKEIVSEFPAVVGFSLDTISGENNQYSGESFMNLTPGMYSIEVVGVGLTEYSVNIGIIRSIGSQEMAGTGNKTLNLTPEQIAAIKESFTQMSFSGVIDKDLTAKYQFTYSSDPTQPIATSEKLVEPGGLKQDIEVCRKMGWIDNDGVAKSLIKKAEAIDAAMARGNNQAAINQLNALTNEIEAQSGKHISSKQESNAVKLLLDDAQLLLNKLQ